MTWLTEAEYDLADCAGTLRGGSRSFHAASLLLPREVRRAAVALYAFCRVADDAIDGAAAADRAMAVSILRDRLDAIYAGRLAGAPADRAFAVVIRRYAIPHALPAALLDGFDWDAQGRRYADIDALLEYAARVAGSVGAMMALVIGVRDEAVLARACELGMAMQLTNIARDVGEDARAGRLYLPLAWLAEAGVDADRFVAAPRYCDGVRNVVARLLSHAEALYAQAADGIAHLPAGCRPAIHAARILYAAIGHRAGAADFDPVAYRAVVPGGRKLLLLPRAVAASAVPARGLSAPPVAAIRYLVEAASHGPAPRAPRPRRAGERFIWALETFAALDSRQASGSP